MKMVIPNETGHDETRVAIDPAAAKKIMALGSDIEVVIEAAAGEKAYHLDADYEKVGVTVATGDAFDNAWQQADLLLTLGIPSTQRIEKIKTQAVLVGMLAPLGNKEAVEQLVEKKATLFSMEFVPRISRAQAMDVLSSQANIGGYMAVIVAARSCPKIFPMMITAAGTIAPAKVFIIGAGVAGLQAIATAKRLGAVVEAYDVRPEVEEQIKSLGARFVKLPAAKQDSSNTGGYAKEQTDEDRQKQVDLMTKHVLSADVVITTAALFGKAPPMLIPNKVVDGMKAGSVLVDLAAHADSGRGNCEATKPGQEYVTDRGVTISGLTNLPALAPVHASQMYANNLLSFLKEIIIDGKVAFDFEDDLQKGACIAHDGEIRNELVTRVFTQSAN